MGIPALVRSLGGMRKVALGGNLNASMLLIMFAALVFVVFSLGGIPTTATSMPE